MQRDSCHNRLPGGRSRDFQISSCHDRKTDRARYRRAWTKPGGYAGQRSPGTWRSTGRSSGSDAVNSSCRKHPLSVVLDPFCYFGEIVWAVYFLEDFCVKAHPFSHEFCNPIPIEDVTIPVSKVLHVVLQHIFIT